MAVTMSKAAILREIANGLERCGEPLSINFLYNTRLQIHAHDLESWARWIGEFGGSAVDGQMIEHDENYWQHRWANDTVAVICLVSRKEES
jgi:hypothetical protein